MHTHKRLEFNCSYQKKNHFHQEKEREMCEVMSVLMVEITLQFILLSNHHWVHIKHNFLCQL